MALLWFVKQEYESLWVKSHPFCAGFQCCIAVLLTALGLWGCGRSSDNSVDLPPPGTMQVLSAVALDSDEPAVNMLKNGDFVEWWAGSPSPVGFFGPTDLHSTVERLWSSPGFVARQTWGAGKFSTNSTDLLRTGPQQLTKGTGYRFSVLASECRGRSVGLSIWAKRSGRWVLYQENAIMIPEMLMGSKRFSVDFIPDQAGLYLFTSQPVVRKEAQVSIIWHEWALEELGNE